MKLGKGSKQLGLLLAILFGSTTSANGADRCLQVVWSTAGSGTAIGQLVVDDAVLNTSGSNQYSSTPAAFVSFTMTIADATSGNGTFVLPTDFTDLYLNLSGPTSLDSEIVSQGTLNDFNVFGTAPAPDGIDPSTFATDGGSGDTFYVSSIGPCPPAFPWAREDEKCQSTIAKAADKYFSTRHKTLVKCRSALILGKPLFTDAAGTIPVTLLSECEDEFKSAAKILKARAKVHDLVAKSCTDAQLGSTVFSCASTVDGLADATGSSGCLLDGVDQSVNSLIITEYTY